ncbi:MAG: hypothetical protein B7C24_09555 [Bacteroidetes bacterium 4572_77]|nr:MAG: hypothetical protein B7C24_09555 [Bacteroidetes bacterium 4572_77]
MKKLLVGLFLLAVVFTSCEKTTVDPIPETPTGNITSDIESDMTFKMGENYVINGTVRVRNCTLVFEPGAIIKFTEGAVLDIAYSDNEHVTFIAKGTPDLPVVFTSVSTSPSAGDWSGIRFYKGANNCQLDYCIVEYSGSHDYYGSLYIDNTEVSITNTILRKASNVGIMVKEEGAFSAFGGNAFSQIQSYPISIQANSVHTIVGVNAFQTDLGVLITNDASYTLSGSHTWTNQAAPYYAEGTIRFGAVGQGSTLNIEKGTHFRMMEDAQWDIAYWDGEYATIIAHGTPEEPIVFTSASPAPSAGDWVGLIFEDGANNCSFNYCVFEYGGSNDYYGTINVKNAAVGFRYCQFLNSQYYGIRMKDNAYFTDFGNNTFANTGIYPITIWPNYVHTITGENTFEQGSAICVDNDCELDIAGNYIWSNQTAPYIVDGFLRVGSAGAGVSLQIEAGTVLKFTSGGGLQIPYWADTYGTLVAIGSAEEPILFTSADPLPNPGDWKGIWFDEGSYNSIINHCEIKYAGGSYDYWGAIYLNDAGSPLSLSNTLISYSGSNAISVDSDDNGSSVDYSNNVSFLNNTGIDYYIR